MQRHAWAAVEEIALVVRHGVPDRGQRLEREREGVVEGGALSSRRDAASLQRVVGEHEHQRVEDHDEREGARDDEQQRAG